MSEDFLKLAGIVVLVVVAVWISIASMGHEGDNVAKKLREQGYQNVTVEQSVWVVCSGKGRYGYKWTATRNGQRIEGEACSGGLFSHTVIKP